MRLEILYFDGCPSHERLLPLLHELATSRGVEFQERRVESVEDAEAMGFLGSPTVRVDGKDVEPGAHDRTDFGLRCRLYRSADGQSGVPPREWIELALDQAAP